MEKLKAELVYLESGKYLTIPKEGNGSLLFLDWLSFENFSESPIEEILNGDLKDGEEVVMENVISVKLKTSTNYMRAHRYINDNL